MKSAKAIALILLILVVSTRPALSANVEYSRMITSFISVVKSGDRAAIANLVAYPLHRIVPLPRIDTPSQFLQHFDEVFDEELLNALKDSSITEDWTEVGWRGVMFNNGTVWLNTVGKVSAVNYITEKGEAERTHLIESEKRNLYSDLRELTEPVLEWKTKDYRIRVDRIRDETYRYAAWPVQKATSEKPDLILNNGTVVHEGSGGNHHYDFKSGRYLYQCDVTVVGAVDSPPGDLYIYKDDQKILSQPVIKVIVGW